MAFDPSTIKPKRFSDETGREARILKLAEQLHGRGITASLADAKRLAEGMVDTERKVLSSGPQKVEDVGALREQLQSSDPLFKAVGVKGEHKLRIPEDFEKFVKKAASLDAQQVPKSYDIPKKEPVQYGREEPQHVPQVPKRGPQIMYAEAPDLATLFDANKQTQTTVEASEDGVVVREETTSENEETVQEVGVIDVPQEPHEKKEEPREELAKKHGVDLFDIFKTG